MQVNKLIKGSELPFIDSSLRSECFRLKNGKEIILKGHHEINELSNADFNALLAEYPHLKTWEEKGFITFNEKKQDNLKADNAINDEKKETERSEKAVEQAVETVKKATDKK